MALPDNIFRVVRSFEVGVVVTLYELDFTKQGGGVFYFTNNVFEQRVPIRFKGHDFIQLPIMMDDVEIDSQAGPAQPHLSIATAGGPTNALIQQYKDLKGVRVWRYQTFAEFLGYRPNGAGGIEPNPEYDPAAVLNLELYVVDRKISADDIYAEFDLVSPTDQEGIMLPLRIVRKRWCDAEYRSYAPEAPGADELGFLNIEHVDGGCPYTGTDYFDEFDQPTDAANDHCSKRVSGCICRYGKTHDLPFSAVPGVRATAEAV